MWIIYVDMLQEEHSRWQSPVPVLLFFPWKGVNNLAPTTDRIKGAGSLKKMRCRISVMMRKGKKLSAMYRM